MEGWLHEVGAALGILLGILIGRRNKTVAKETECEQCKAREKFPCPAPGLPPAQFWLTVTGGVVAVVVGYTTLQIEVRELRVWRAQTEGARFTDSDGAVLEQRAAKELEIVRNFARGNCRELKRLQVELGKIPRDDCQVKP